jgi:hypothetical protein
MPLRPHYAVHNHQADRNKTSERQQTGAGYPSTQRERRADRSNQSARDSPKLSHAGIAWHIRSPRVTYRLSAIRQISISYFDVAF